MFILVLAAAVWFLLQGQQTLQGELSTSEETIQSLENQQAEMELNEQALQATLETEQNSHATTAFENVDLEGQLSESANANSTLEAVSAEQASELETVSAAVSTIESQGPIVSIIEPQAGQNLVVNEQVEIVIVASDPRGVIKVQFTINSVPEPFQEDFEGGSTETLRETWVPSVPGSYTITASAINSQEILSQNSTVTFNVAEPQPTETPTPTTTPEPTEEPTPEPTTES